MEANKQIRNNGDARILNNLPYTYTDERGIETRSLEDGEVSLRGSGPESRSRVDAGLLSWVPLGL